MTNSDERSAEFFRSVRQGHVFSVASARAEVGSKQLVVVSQTCDVVLPKRPRISLALVVKLDGPECSQAATGINPRQVSLPALGGGQFADLCFIESRDKSELVGLELTPGIDLSNEQVKRDFSLSMARWFGRFPFPDEVVPWLQPLERVVREKYRKQSTLGELLREVIVEIRVEEAGQWSRTPFKLEVHTIARAEALPTLPDEVSASPDDFVKSLREEDGTVKAPEVLAEILATTEDALHRNHVLLALAESFAALCKPKESYEHNAIVSGAVSEVGWQLWSDDEFPLSRVRKSEPLDLEYLSEPDRRT